MTRSETAAARHVLIIDDDQGFTALVRHLLEERGHRVDVLGDGFDALDLLARETPDVILVDHVLPRLDGDELCRVARARERLAGVRLVLVSAAALEAELDLEPGLVDLVVAKDTFPRMVPHLVAAVEEDDLGERAAPGVVVGAEQVHPRRVVRELIGRKRHLERILDRIDEGIVELDRGRVVFANRTACDLLGVRHPAILECSEGELLGDATGETGRNDRGGARRHVERNGRRLEAWTLGGDGDGGSHRIVVLTDVTEREHLHNRLRRAEKLESVGVMASGVAHNFNNLLQGVLGSSAMLELTEGISPGGKELLRNITLCCHRGADLTRRLLEYARTRPEQRVLARPEEVVVGALRIVEQGRQDITITRELASDLPSFEVDPTQIEEVLVALLMNAAQVMEFGGEVQVRAEGVTVGPASRWASSVPAGEYVAISVRDHGPGILPEHRERVFDPFFTTHADDDHPGLGLASALGAVTGHGGTIEFDTRIGGGTTFTVLLPAAGSSRAQPREAPVDRPAGGRRVLLVDDDPLILRTCRKMLEHLRFDVLTSDSGARAIEVFANAGDSVDLVILDVAMPDMNGWELADALRARSPELPVLFTSGYRLEALGDRRRVEVEHFLAKPFTLDALRDAVDAALPEGDGGTGAGPPDGR